MVFDTSDDRFGAYAGRLSDLAKYKRDEPKRAWKDVVAGQQKAVAGTLTPDEEEQFKQDRRAWNRQYKSTPVGIMASGVDLGADPFGAQDLYHDMSSQLAYDVPKTYDRMYPFSPNRLSQAAGNILGSTLPARIFKSMVGEREPIVPKNVLAMRERFPGIGEINKLVPGGGIANFVPEYQRQKAVFDMNETINEGKGIYAGRGDLPSDFDYEEDKEGRELSAKISFLESVNPHIDYDNVDPLLIDELYEEALEMNKFMSGNIGALNPLQPDLTEK